MRKSVVLFAALLPSLSFAATDCDLNRSFGPVSFNHDRPAQAIKKILDGTGIALVEPGDIGMGTITARNIQGSVKGAMERLSEGAGLTYTCKNGVMRLAEKTSNNREPRLSGLQATNPVVAVAIPAKPPAQVWTLTAGRTIGQELQSWGEKVGWKVIWSLPKDWSVPASTAFAGDFQTAAADVIKTLAANGALVRAQFYGGNKTLVVTGPGVAEQ